MQKKHGMTVMLASLSAATASIVAGALVSQHAVAQADSPPKATVTVVTGSTDGSDAYTCTFDDLVLPEPGSAVGAGTPMIGAAGGSGEGPIRVEHAAVADAGSGPAHPPVLATGAAPAEDVTPVGPVSFGDTREGTAEECAAVRADLPLAVATAVPTDPNAKTGR